VLDRQRHPHIPDVPTVVELGRPELVMTTWFGIAMPKDTPAAIVQRVNAEIGKALASPEVIAKLNAMGVDAAKPDAPAAFARFMADDVARWKKVVKDSGVAVD
jgi:tripartite-type tricarboxylate transporter receptor subunit TctC